MRKLPSGNWNTTVKINGKQISVTAPTKAECEYQASLLKTKRKQKTDITVRDCINKYIALSETLSPTTLLSYEKIEKYAFKSIIDIPVNALDSMAMQNAVNIESKRLTQRTGKPISAKTVKNEWTLLASAIKTVTGNVYQVKLPKIQHKNIILPEPQVIINKIKGTDIELPCLLAMWCGLRISEIRGLTYDSIHEDYISIDKVIVDVGKESILKELAKTDLSIRKVPMPNYIKGLIKTHGKAKNDLVVPLTRNSIYDRFTKLMKEEGFDISFHSLRHEYASILLTKLGISEKIVQKSGGWATTGVMQTIYSNTFSNSEVEASMIRDKYFESML